jgi:DNA invertase Pin-like site-specific DNA recombinase
MDAFVLVRQSGRKDGGDSIEVQESGGRSFAAGREANVVDVVGRSNRSGRSEAWAQTLRDTVERAKHEGVGMIVVAWSSDRFARNEAVSAEIITACDAAGIQLLTTSGQRLTFKTADEWERNRTDAVRDEAYSRRTGERVTANKERRKAAGKLTGRIPALGFESVPSPDGDGRVAQEIPEHTPAVRRAFEMWADGQRDDAILAMLDEAGYPLSATALRTMIASPIYIGRLPWQGGSYEGAHEGTLLTLLFSLS